MSASQVFRAVLPKCAADAARMASKEAGRFALHCVRVSVHGSTATIEATDGRRLIQARYVSDMHEGEGSFMLDARHFAAALKAGGMGKGSVAHVILLDDGSVRFELPTWTVSLRKNDGTLPEFKDVIPPSVTSKGLAAGSPLGFYAEVAGNAMVAGAKAAGGKGVARAWRFYANGANAPVRLECDADMLMDTSADGEAREMRAEVLVVVMPVALDTPQEGGPR
jgi:hypothetical protein